MNSILAGWVEVQALAQAAGMILSRSVPFQCHISHLHPPRAGLGVNHRSPLGAGAQGVL